MQASMVVAVVIGMAACSVSSLQYLPEWGIYCSAVLWGLSGSFMIILSLAFTADMIGYCTVILLIFGLVLGAHPSVVIDTTNIFYQLSNFVCFISSVFEKLPDHDYWVNFSHNLMSRKLIIIILFENAIINC